MITVIRISRGSVGFVSSGGKRCAPGAAPPYEIPQISITVTMFHMDNMLSCNNPADIFRKNPEILQI